MFPGLGRIVGRGIVVLGAGDWYAAEIADSCMEILIEAVFEAYCFFCFVVHFG